MKVLYFTVTNDLTYDQRMIRICRSLAGAGYRVYVVGRRLRSSLPLTTENFQQVRLYCWFTKGMLFYAEYNIRLFFFLLFRRMDLIGAIDLDTILPCYLISLVKGTKRTYDAHELFTEMKEVVTRPWIHRIWKAIEKFTVPHFSAGYTVSPAIAEILNSSYRTNFIVIRNIARFKEIPQNIKQEKIIIYQGAVNEGRSFETLIPAMQWVHAPLHIYGDGNFMHQVQNMIEKYNLGNKILCKGKIIPENLHDVTSRGWIGLTFFENTGLSNYHSLANRFFDYIQAGLPQLCVDYPAYRDINAKYECAVLIDDLSPENIARHLNNLLEDEVLYNRLRSNARIAARELNWENEEKNLLELYNKLLN